MSYFRSNLKEKVVLDITNGMSVGGHCVVLNCETVGELFDLGDSSAKRPMPRADNSDDVGIRAARVRTG
jgi:hypothetical protein